jgi:hypothetical protein
MERSLRHAPWPRPTWTFQAVRVSTCERSPRAVLDGLLDGRALRALDPGQAIRRLQQVKGLGPFAAGLGAVRPATHCPHQRRLDAEIAEQYCPGRTLAKASQAGRPYRNWAAVHLRAPREQRTSEITGRALIATRFYSRDGAASMSWLSESLAARRCAISSVSLSRSCISRAVRSEV